MDDPIDYSHARPKRGLNAENSRRLQLDGEIFSLDISSHRTIQEALSFGSPEILEAAPIVNASALQRPA